VPALDALRAFAVFLVIGAHYHWPQTPALAVSIADNPLFRYGWTGVDLFFVLSGLLIGKQLWRELDKTGTVRIPRFLLRRGLRIWPLYYAIIAYFTAFRPAPFDWPEWVFLSNYFPTTFERSWSLSTEEQFYVAVPLLLLVITRFLPRKAHVWPLVALTLAVPVVRVFEWQRVRALGLSPEALVQSMNYPIHVHCEALLIGLILALLSTRQPKIFVPTGRWGTSPRAIAVTAVCVVVGLALDFYNKDIFAFFALALIFGSLTFFVLCDRSFLTLPLRSKFFYPFSRLAYGMYLNHFWFVPGSTAWTIRHLSGVLPPVAVFIVGLLIGTAISAGVAVVTFIAIEHPFLQLREHLLADKPEIRRAARPMGEPALVEAVDPGSRS
jgi:peptidoglycan/LPS O-acetylase OafA/YrhL